MLASRSLRKSSAYRNDKKLLLLYPAFWAYKFISIFTRMSIDYFQTVFKEIGKETSLY